jgi:plastocyanin
MRTSSVAIVTLTLAIALGVGGCGGMTTTAPSRGATTAASGDGRSASQQVTVPVKDFALGHGATSSATFPKAVRYPYPCTVHPSVLGTGTVT